MRLTTFPPQPIRWTFRVQHRGQSSHEGVGQIFRKHSLTEDTDTSQMIEQYHELSFISIYNICLKKNLGKTVFMSDTGLYHDPIRQACYVMHSHRLDRRVILTRP